MFVFLVTILPVLTSSVTICICQVPANCTKESQCNEENSFNPNDPLTSGTFYLSIIYLIGREQDVDLYFVKDNIWDYYWRPEFKIDVFQSKNLKFSASNNFEPEYVNLTYSEGVDFRTIHIESDLDLLFKGDSADIPVRMHPSKMNNNAMFKFDPIPKDSSLVIPGEQVDLSAYSGFNKFEFSSKNITIKLSWSTYTFNLTKEGLYYNVAGFDRALLVFPKGAKYTIMTTESYGEINLVGFDITDYKQFENMHIEGFSRYSFFGEWPDNPPENLKTLGVEDDSTMKFTIKSKSIPFNLIGASITLFIIENVTFKGTIKVFEEHYAYNKRIQIETNLTNILTVHMKEIITPSLNYQKGPFDVTIDSFNFYGEQFPITTCLDEYGISKNNVKEMNVSKDFTTTELLVYSILPEKLSADDLHQLFDNLGYFLQFPNMDWLQSENLVLKYDGYNSRPGFGNSDSWIGFKKELNSQTNSYTFTFIWEKDPLETPLQINVGGSESYQPDWYGPNLDLKVIMDKYPTTKNFYFKFYGGVDGEPHTYKITSSVDFSLDNYQFTFEYADNADVRAIFSEFNIEKINTSKIKFIKFSKCRFDKAVKIGGEKIELSDVWFNNKGSTILETNYLRSDVATLEWVPRAQVDNKKTLEVDLYDKTGTYNMYIHNNTVTINDRATLPFDNSHTLTFHATGSFNIHCDSGLKQIEKFYGFSVNFTGYNYQHHKVSIYNFPEIKEIIRPITFNNFDECELSIYISVITTSDIAVLNGKGEIKSDYGDPETYCLCPDGKCSKIDSSCHDDKSGTFDVVSTLVSNSNFQFIHFLVLNSETNSFPVINVSSLLNRKIDFNIGNGQTGKSFKLGLNNDVTDEDIGMSELIIGEHCQSIVVKEVGNNKITLDKIIITETNISFENFKTVDFTVRELSISPESISSFKSITIKEKLNLESLESTGSQEWTGSVNFEKGFSETRLSLRYGSFDKQLTYGNEQLTIDKIIFNIPSQKEIAVELTLTSFSSTISNEATDITSIPRTIISGGTSDSFTLKFIGSWPKSDESMITLSTKGSVNLSLNDVIPIDIDLIGTGVKFIATSASVGIMAMHLHTEEKISQYLIEFDTSLKDQNVIFDFRNVFTIDQVNSGSGFWDPVYQNIKMSFVNSQIQCNFDGFALIDKYGNPADPSDEDPITLEFQIVMTDKFMNKLTINKNSYPINIEKLEFIANIPKGSNLDEMPLVVNEFVAFIVGPKSILETFDIENLTFKNSAADGSQSFGFLTNDNVVGFRLAESSETENPSLQAYLTMPLYDKEYVVEFMDKDSQKLNNVVDFITGPNYLSQLHSSILSKIKYLKIFIPLDITETLDFSLLDSKLEKKVNISLNALSISMHEIPFTFCSKINSISFENIRIIKPLKTAKLMTTPEIQVLTLMNSVIEEDALVIDNNIKLLNVTIGSYDNLIKSKQLQSFTNTINLLKANFVTFTENGWNVQEYYGTPTVKISKEEVSRVSLDCYDVIRFSLNPETLTTIHSIPMNIRQSNPNYDITVTFGKGWNFVTDINTLKIKSTVPFRIYTSSYPLPDIFDESSNYELHFDDQSSDISVELYDGYTISDAKMFNLTELLEQDRVLTATNVKFVGKSSLSFVENKGVFQAQKILITNHSRTLIHSTNVENVELVEDSQLTIELLSPIHNEIRLLWNYANFPTLTLSSIVENSSFVIQYNGEPKIDNATYNSVLKNFKQDILIGDPSFDCESWLESTKFDSTIPEFSNEPVNGIFELECNTNANSRSLSIAVIKELPDGEPIYTSNEPTIEPETDTQSPTETDPDQGGDSNKPLSTGGIVGIAFACFIVAAVSTGIVVYFCTRNKYEKLLINSSLESNNELQTQATNE
ncbi:hypothetical protein TRFO_36551 [Tritrichomonas foetus]|uniref:Uncharacterized protein n=1 Tax=Tritrichomonas foetus TaxID=1144522 RepID=A0A1J4JDK0_9EUKA|nr:hypothetical protein TRFO_36551 [Tritrichomonas foetus]|eukprot:OHS97234.1 hypothetical protein TRFO_36551 [Tritrichomonas foetus]